MTIILVNYLFNTKTLTFIYPFAYILRPTLAEGHWKQRTRKRQWEIYIYKITSKGITKSIEWNEIVLFFLWNRFVAIMNFRDTPCIACSVPKVCMNTQNNFEFSNIVGSPVIVIVGNKNNVMKSDPFTFGHIT